MASPRFNYFQADKESSAPAYHNLQGAVEKEADTEGLWMGVLADMVEQRRQEAVAKGTQDRELSFRREIASEQNARLEADSLRDDQRGREYARLQREGQQATQARFETEQAYRDNQRSKEYDRLWNEKNRESMQKERFSKYIEKQVGAGLMDDNEAALARMVTDIPEEREKYVAGRIKGQQEEATRTAERKQADDTFKQLEKGGENLEGDDKLQYHTDLETLRASGLTGKELRSAVAPLLFKSLAAATKADAAKPEKPISVGGVKYEDRTGLAKGGVLRDMNEQQEAALELLAREVAAKDPRAKLKGPDNQLVYADQTPLVEEAKATLTKLFGWTETNPMDPFDSPQMNPAKFSDQPGGAQGGKPTKDSILRQAVAEDWDEEKFIQAMKAAGHDPNE